MSCYKNENLIEEAIHVLAMEGFEALPKLVSRLMNEAMLIERERHLNASPYERTGDRNGYANGFKPRLINTGQGQLELQIPQVRDSNEAFYPSVLERGVRSDRALKLAVAEMYVHGVSTRKVEKVLKQLCGTDISSTEVSRCAKLLDEDLKKWRNKPLGKIKYLWLDARYEKVRTSGTVQDCAVLIAYGFDESTGKRTVLGVSVALSEAEVHWRDFLQQLVERGIHGIELITSDAHTGLKAARRAVFPSVPWQRCQFHLQQNAQAHIPKRSMKEPVAEEITAIFNALNIHESERLLAMAVDKYQQTAPELSSWLEVNIPEGLVVMNFDRPHQKRLRTSNIAERVNREVKRRTHTVGIFPNTESCLRLVSAVLVEIDDQWSGSPRYLS